MTDYPDSELIENLRFNIRHWSAAQDLQNIKAEVRLVYPGVTMNEYHLMDQRATSGGRQSPGSCHTWTIHRRALIY